MKNKDLVKSIENLLGKIRRLRSEGGQIIEDAKELLHTIKYIQEPQRQPRTQVMPKVVPVYKDCPYSDICDLAARKRVWIFKQRPYEHQPCELLKSNFDSPCPVWLGYPFQYFSTGVADKTCGLQAINESCVRDVLLPGQLAIGWEYPDGHYEIIKVVECHLVEE